MHLDIRLELDVHTQEEHEVLERVGAADLVTELVEGEAHMGGFGVLEESVDHFVHEVVEVDTVI